MIRVSHDFTVLKTFPSPESPVLPILPKKFATRLRRVFFFKFFQVKCIGIRWLQKALEFNGKPQRSAHSKFAKKKC